MNKKILLIGLIIVVISMSIGFALYSTSLKVKGTGNIDSNFNIEVTGITEDKKEGKAVSITNPTYTKTSATFNTKLSREKDNIEYKVEITNKGSIDGKIENITITNPNELIKVETRGIEKGQIIKSGEVLEYIVRVYIPEGTKINEDITSKIEVNTEIIQDDNQIFNEPIDGVEANKLEIESTIEESDYTSIKCTVNAKGNGLKYSYSLDDKTYTEPSESNTYTFNNLLPNKRYTVYYKVEDKDGNYVTESKWIETKHDNTAPECELEIKEITLDNIKIKASCTDETEIVKYELSDNGGLYVDKKLQSEYDIDNLYLSKIKIKVTDLAGNNKEYKFNEEQLNTFYQNLYEQLNNEYQNTVNDKDNYKEDFLNKTYPIGSIYMTESSINPGTTIGGTWERYGKGKKLVGVSENDADFNIVNKTGGSKSNTLAITNLPLHDHSIPSLSGTAASAGAHTHSIPALSGTTSESGSHTHGLTYADDYGTINHWGIAWKASTTSRSGSTYGVSNAGAHKHTLTTSISTTGTSGAHTHAVTTNGSTTGSVGSGSAFTNLSPYITVYMWKRIN